MDEGPPLIVSSRAARRLRLLQVPGLPPSSATAGKPTATSPPPGLLSAALLAEPPPPPGGEWQHERDPLAELAVTVRTLRELQASPAATSSKQIARTGLPPLLLDCSPSSILSLLP